MKMPYRKARETNDLIVQPERMGGATQPLSSEPSTRSCPIGAEASKSYNMEHKPERLRNHELVG
jgi:hypothetical protein